MEFNKGRESPWAEGAKRDAAKRESIDDAQGAIKSFIENENAQGNSDGTERIGSLEDVFRLSLELARLSEVASYLTGSVSLADHRSLRIGPVVIGLNPRLGQHSDDEVSTTIGFYHIGYKDEDNFWSSSPEVAASFLRKMEEKTASGARALQVKVETYEHMSKVELADLFIADLEGERFPRPLLPIRHK